MIERIVQWIVGRLNRWLSDREKARVERLLGGTRSPQWSAVRNAFIKKNPLCAVCKTDKDCEAHHEVPFSRDSSLELKESNLLTLCRPHHYLVGHLMSWSSFNKSVRGDSLFWDEKIRNRPE